VTSEQAPDDKQAQSPKQHLEAVKQQYTTPMLCFHTVIELFLQSSTFGVYDTYIKQVNCWQKYLKSQA
jgi:hypothetical protein